VTTEERGPSFHYIVAVHDSFLPEKIGLATNRPWLCDWVRADRGKEMQINSDE